MRGTFQCRRKATRVSELALPCVAEGQDFCHCAGPVRRLIQRTIDAAPATESVERARSPRFPDAAVPATRRA
jgi:hypothetical protein